MQNRKMYHIFQPTYIWPDFTKSVIESNAGQMVEILQMPKIDRQPVVSRVTAKESVMQLKDAHEMLRTKVDTAKAWFATHIGVKNLDAFKHMHTKLEPWYQLDSEYDMQQSFGCKLEGINEPQMFFKGDGAWTGLHVEDCGLASFNINFGPGVSLWTLIHEDEGPKLLSALKKELKTTENLNIRSIRLVYHFSTDFLKRHDIKYDRVLQRSGYAIYVPGYTMHQVRNLGSGANIAWNLLLSTSETLQHMMKSYEFETLEAKDVAMVPVLRVVHHAYFRFKERLTADMQQKMLSFMYRNLAHEISKCDKVQKRRINAKKTCELQWVFRLEYKNCEECARAFYASAFVKNVVKREVWVCYECAVKTPVRNNMCWRVFMPQNELLQYFADKLDTAEQEHEAADDRAKWLYSNSPTKSLKWFAELAPGECVLDVLRRKTKRSHIERQIQELEEKMHVTQESIDRTVNKNKRDEFKRRLEKQTDCVSRLKACKRKCDTVLEVLQAQARNFHNN